MINFDESCLDIAEYFCDDPLYLEHYIVQNNFILLSIWHPMMHWFLSNLSV